MLTPLDAGRDNPDPLINTFSIVAYDPKTRDLGVAVQSRYLAVGSVVPWAKAGVGAVATQAMAKVTFGPDGLKLLEQGNAPEEVLKKLLAADSWSDVRQVAVIDAKGKAAAHTGEECQEWAGHRIGENFSVQGNILTGPEVLEEMAKAYETARGTPHSELADWLVAALQAGQGAGGDRRGKQSAALLVVRENGGPGGDHDRYIDLRVDDHAEPIEELARLLGLHNLFHPHLHSPKRGPAAAR
ncbi:MAG: DUF1028 domain-containing protein [Chthoniobacteraceae bacterium]